MVDADDDTEARVQAVQAAHEQRVAGRAQHVGEQLAVGDVEVALRIRPAHEGGRPGFYQQPSQERAGGQHRRQGGQRRALAARPVRSHAFHLSVEVLN